MSKEYLTTGDVAALCSVTPDAVLKWIKSGKISAIQTPGGHYRIHKTEIPSDLIQEEKSSLSDTCGRPFQYCWEFHAKNGKLLEMCLYCIVYRAKVKRCYEMSQLPVETGHARQFCATSCDDCDYYQMVLGQQFKVLIVTNRPEFQAALETEVSKKNIQWAFCNSEYRCAVTVSDFLPDFVLIDSAMGEEQCKSLTRYLCEDSHLPIVRIILAGAKYDVPSDCRKEIFARINSDCSALEVSDLIERLSG